MANGGQLPGLNIFSVLAQIPTDFINLGVRHVGEVNTVLAANVQRLGAELATPPQFPTGLPQLPSLPAGLPQLSNLLPGMSAAPSPAAASVAGMGFGSEYAVAPRMII